jgi:hypothetical protein
MTGLVLIAMMGAAQLTTTILALYPPKQDKRQFRRLIAIVGLVGIALTVWIAKRQQDSSAAAEIVLDSRHWLPDSMILVPNQDLLVEVAMKVKSATARDTESYFDGFVMHGEPTPEQNREAIAKFKKEMIDHPTEKHDWSEGTRLMYQPKFNFDPTQVEDVKFGRTIIYVMAYARWKNKVGGSYEVEYYAYMNQPGDANNPGNNFIGNQQWHNFSK